MLVQTGSSMQKVNCHLWYFLFGSLPHLSQLEPLHRDTHLSYWTPWNACITFFFFFFAYLLESWRELLQERIYKRSLPWWSSNWLVSYTDWLASSPGSPPPLFVLYTRFYLREIYVQASKRGGGEPGDEATDWSRSTEGPLETELETGSGRQNYLANLHWRLSVTTVSSTCPHWQCLHSTQ